MPSKKEEVVGVSSWWSLAIVLGGNAYRVTLRMMVPHYQLVLFAENQKKKKQSIHMSTPISSHGLLLLPHISITAPLPNSTLVLLKARNKCIQSLCRLYTHCPCREWDGSILVAILSFA